MDAQARAAVNRGVQNQPPLCQASTGSHGTSQCVPVRPVQSRREAVATAPRAAGNGLASLQARFLYPVVLLRITKLGLPLPSISPLPRFQSAAGRIRHVAGPAGAPRPAQPPAPSGPEPPPAAPCCPRPAAPPGTRPGSVSPGSPPPCGSPRRPGPPPPTPAGEERENRSRSTCSLLRPRSAHGGRATSGTGCGRDRGSHFQVLGAPGRGGPQTRSVPASPPRAERARSPTRPLRAARRASPSRWRRRPGPAAEAASGRRGARQGASRAAGSAAGMGRSARAHGPRARPRQPARPACPWGRGPDPAMCPQPVGSAAPLREERGRDPDPHALRDAHLARRPAVAPHHCLRAHGHSPRCLLQRIASGPRHCTAQSLPQRRDGQQDTVFLGRERRKFGGWGSGPEGAVGRRWGVGICSIPSGLCRRLPLVVAAAGLRPQSDFFE